MNKIPVWIASALLGVFILLESWTLDAVVQLKVDVSAIKAQIADVRQNQ